MFLSNTPYSCVCKASTHGKLQEFCHLIHVLSTCVAGLLDVDAVALAGHSYGGATVTALCSQEPAFKCTVAYDPWW